MPPLKLFFVSFREKELCTKFCDVLIRSVTFKPWFRLDIFVNFMEIGSPTKFHGVFDHFSETYEEAKL